LGADERAATDNDPADRDAIESVSSRLRKAPLWDDRGEVVVNGLEEPSRVSDVIPTDTAWEARGRAQC